MQLSMSWSDTQWICVHAVWGQLMLNQQLTEDNQFPMWCVNAAWIRTRSPGRPCQSPTQTCHAASCCRLSLQAPTTSYTCVTAAHSTTVNTVTSKVQLAHGLQELSVIALTIKSLLTAGFISMTVGLSQHTVIINVMTEFSNVCEHDDTVSQT